MQHQLGDEAADFFAALDSPSPVSIRINHFKGKAQFALNDPVKWCDTGYYLDERPFFHLDPHWHGGAYYVQEASSMILDAVVKQLPRPSGDGIWVDLCAAPGGKTGILAKHLGPGDVLIANEVVSQRKSVLYENLVKGGYLNTFITGEKTSAFPGDFADVILIDAPCAGEGMMRKEPEAARQWSDRLVQSCALLQKDIVSDAVKTLKPGGWLIYSTCSYSPDENIDNAVSFISRHPLENVNLNFNPGWNISEITKANVTGYQLYPHKVRGEGLFITVFQKKCEKLSKYNSSKKEKRIFHPLTEPLDQFVNDPSKYLSEKRGDEYFIITAEASNFASSIRVQLPRAELTGKFIEQKGKDFIPDHFLATSGIQGKIWGSVKLDEVQALDYLERKIPMVEKDNPTGWYVINFDGTLLGWMKNTAQGWKNYFPMHWRLRNRK